MHTGHRTRPHPVTKEAGIIKDHLIEPGEHGRACEAASQGQGQFNWLTIGLQLAYSWLTIGLQLACNWLTIGLQLAYNWLTIGLHASGAHGINSMRNGSQVSCMPCATDHKSAVVRATAWPTGYFIRAMQRSEYCSLKNACLVGSLLARFRQEM